MIRNSIRGLFLSVIATVAIGLTSCDVLDSDYYMGEPTDKVFSTPEGIRSAAVGMYDLLQHPEFLGGRMQIYADLRGLDVNASPFFSSIYSFNLLSSDPFIEKAWTGAYRSIYECNLFLENIANVKDDVMPSEERIEHEAEARFLRATCYFYMVNFWGQQYTPQGNLGVPLVLRSFDCNSAVNGSAAMPRETADNIYKQITNDLLFAEKNLPLTWSSECENRTRATQIAASAMLSRVYLYQKKYKEAIDEANLVITPPQKSRVPSLAKDLKTDCFTSNEKRKISSEIIFWVGMNATDNPNTNNAIGQHYGATKLAHISVSSSFINLFEASDKRLDLIATKGSIKYCNKYPNGIEDWAPIIRFAEVLLNKAEALAQNDASINKEALQIINDIRARSGASSISASQLGGKQDLIQLILDERRRELAFEGLSSFDLFRNGKGIPAQRGVATAPEITYPNNLFAAPIPSIEVQRNTKLVQNNGY